MNFVINYTNEFYPKIIDYQKRNYETIEKFYESMEKDMSALVKGEQNV